jgi:ribosomal protein L11 methyltransferase
MRIPPPSRRSSANPACRRRARVGDVRALFADEALATDAATLLLAQEWAQGIHVQAIAPVEDQDWVRLTQSQFQPVAITPAFWIVPSWHEPPAGAKRVIRLDPGLAFGTGTHPTTRMCLRWTAQHAAARASHWTRVLDYGCGSGILAIGAALHGATHIDAVDIDPAAVESTRLNAIANGVTLAAGLPDAAHGTYPLVYANILATPLKLLAPLLCGHVAPGGDLVLAGILERQADELISAYAPWLELGVSDTDDGWILMTARRTA